MTRLVLLSLLGAAGILSTPGARAADNSAFCAANPADYFLAEDQNCSLTWKGVTLYGAVDVGGGYQTHGVPFNRFYPNGVEELISKNSNKALFVPLPNGVGQSNVGIKGDEPLNGDLSFIFNLQTGFDPYSVQLANGPKSLVENNTNALAVQNANGNSSRAGQIFNTVAYAGVSHPLFGAFTAGRQDSLILDNLAAYDPMGAAPAFSVIGASNTAGGVGDTEDARYATSLQYRVNVGNLRFATLYQVGGYGWGNGTNGAVEALIGADFGNLSVEAIGNRVKDAVSLSNYATWPLPSGVTIDNLKATLSDNTSGVLMAKYTFSRFKFYAGFEYILFQNPSDAYPYGFTTLGGYTVLPGAVKTDAYDISKILRVFWTGVKYPLRDDLDIAGAIYHYYQNDYNSQSCTNDNLSASSCKGSLDAASFMVDYHISRRLELYGGLMWSQVAGGLASGYLYHQNYGPAVGLRAEF